MNYCFFCILNTGVMYYVKRPLHLSQCSNFYFGFLLSNNLLLVSCLCKLGYNVNKNKTGKEECKMVL